MTPYEYKGRLAKLVGSKSEPTLVSLKEVFWRGKREPAGDVRVNLSPP
jgi:hypothetical protein